MLGCAYTICSYGQISISCTSSSRLPCPPSHVLSYTPPVVICCIRLLWDWSFHIYHHINYVRNFVASSLFSLIWLLLLALFCAAIWRDSVFLLKFLFLNQVFSCLLLISRLKRPWICLFVFFSYFSFLVILILWVIVLSVSFLRAVISPTSFFSIVSLSPSIDASTLSSMLTSHLPPPFLIHIVCQRRLWDVMPYALSLVFLFFGLFA